jgi:hypothetical protein
MFPFCSFFFLRPKLNWTEIFAVCCLFDAAVLQGTGDGSMMSRGHQKWMVRMYQNPLLKYQPALELCRGSKGILPATVNMSHECGASIPPFTDA